MIEMHCEWVWTCDRCGYTDTVADERDQPAGWTAGTAVDAHLCKGCMVDLRKFLRNEPVEPMPLGDGYRHAHLFEGTRP